MMKKLSTGLRKAIKKMGLLRHINRFIFMSVGHNFAIPICQEWRNGSRSKGNLEIPIAIKKMPLKKSMLFKAS